MEWLYVHKVGSRDRAGLAAIQHIWQRVADAMGLAIAQELLFIFGSHWNEGEKNEKGGYRDVDVEIVEVSGGARKERKDWAARCVFLIFEASMSNNESTIACAW